MIEELKKMKKDRGYSNKKLSELSGVPVATIQKIFSGETKSPRYTTLMALKIALVCGEEVWELHDSATAPATPHEISEKSSVRPDQRRKRVGYNTIDNYYALPEGTRVELIDGIFYDMAAPTTIHQEICGEIYRILKNHIKNNNGACMPFISPTDVQLDCDDKTMVQPDVAVVCDRDKITRSRIVGAPDLVVEVVSPGNTSTDVMIKLLKYKNAGVREYWIIFPEEKNVMVYDFTKSDLPYQYSFMDKVPVGIWDGKCEVDFKEMYEEIEFMYEGE